MEKQTVSHQTEQYIDAGQRWIQSMTRIGESFLAGGLMCLAIEVWMADSIAPGIQMYTAISIAGFAVAALGRWRRSRKDDGAPL